MEVSGYEQDKDLKGNILRAGRTGLRTHLCWLDGRPCDLPDWMWYV